MRTKGGGATGSGTARRRRRRRLRCPQSLTLRTNRRRRAAPSWSDGEPQAAPPAAAARLVWTKFCGTCSATGAWRSKSCARAATFSPPANTEGPQRRPPPQKAEISPQKRTRKRAAGPGKAPPWHFRRLLVTSRRLPLLIPPSHAAQPIRSSRRRCWTRRCWTQRCGSSGSCAPPAVFSTLPANSDPGNAALRPGSLSFHLQNRPFSAQKEPRERNSAACGLQSPDFGLAEKTSAVSPAFSGRASPLGQSEATAGTVGRSAVGAADAARLPPPFQPSQQILTPKTALFAPESLDSTPKMASFGPKSSLCAPTALLWTAVPCG